MWLHYHWHWYQSIITEQTGCVSLEYDSYPLLGSIGFKLLDLTHERGQTLTRLFVLLIVLLRVTAIQLHLLIIHTCILTNKNTSIAYITLLSVLYVFFSKADCPNKLVKDTKPHEMKVNLTSLWTATFGGLKTQCLLRLMRSSYSHSVVFCRLWPCGYDGV